MYVILEDAGGDGSVPYQALMEEKLSITVAGLPDGLKFQKPSQYGRNQLKKILDAAEDLSFEISKICTAPYFGLDQYKEGVSAPLGTQFVVFIIGVYCITLVKKVTLANC